MDYIQNTTKINQLIKSWHRGTIKTVKELERFGYSPQLLKSYSKSGWLKLYTRGSYQLSDDIVKWEGVLYGLQNRSNTTLHAGGRTALELKGFGHFARVSAKYIFGDRGENYNVMLKKVKDLTLKKTKVFPYDEERYFTKYKVDGFEISISSPELAAMEMIYLIPLEQSFNEATLIMENLTTLRPKMVQTLLEKCESYKVKRIFMWMAERNDHTWVKDLDLKKIDFGKGKLSVVKSGMFNKKYNITVPRENER